ncbi:hypothetical protein CKM354_000324300 [Cercospora kikuchii]|uniref:Zn(2)-C6 fungal-type domain-containing protein n=1 Tax=Cercospora kikuchii TaxID=84275 RepID=A0A9P3CBP3_9PEZI|nr:uncharacterized protein CKM354_000324300 [Cercospora kikuchii]GIZ39878.1 hypothetical protein CKM354_000324300 [Cercospora kikuchii]
MESKATVRSCTTCHKAKARCVRRVGQEICERCARLKKECHAKEPILRRRKSIKTTRAAQLEKLESKIEHLVNALSSQQSNPPTRSDHGQPSPPVSHVPSERAGPRGEISQELISSLCCDATEQDLEPEEVSRDQSPTKNGIASNRLTAVTLSEAEHLLNRYQRLMSPGLPFVIIPTSVTAQELYKAKPVLLRAITTVALFHDLPRQRLLVKELIRDMSDRIMLKGEKSIDLLQAIIIFVAWSHPHVFLNRQTNNMLYLAMAMVADMGLGRQPHSNAIFGVELRAQSNEGHRILLGLFYFSSMLSSSFHRIDAMPFTRHMESCLRTLEQCRERESDCLLVQMVRLQQIMQSMCTADLSTVPAKVYTKALKADLDRVGQSDPSKGDNLFLRMQSLLAEVFLWEMTLNGLVEDRNVSLSSVLDDLYQCVSAVKAFVEAFFDIPPSLYLTLPFSVFAQFGHAFIVLTKLASLDIDGWDVKALNDQLNFSYVIEESARLFEEATRAGPDGIVLNNNALGKWSQRVLYMQSVYKSRFGEMAMGSSRSTTDVGKYTPRQDNFGHPTPPDDILNVDFFNYLDADFWSTVDFSTDLGFGTAGNGITAVS